MARHERLGADDSGATTRLARPAAGQPIVTLEQGLGLMAFLLVTAAAASVGSIFMPGPWYAALAKPWWTPPGWVFGPAWTVLYLLIAIAGWLVWREQGVGVLVALWAAQLAVNAAWSYIMFGSQNIAGALVDVALLWVLVLAFSVLAWPVSQTASMLFWPYLAWVSFAGALNFEVWRLNN